MTRRLFALLLLAAFGFGFLAGPHPCAAWHGDRESGQPSCHESGHSPAGPQLRADTHGDDGCGSFCPHACHMTATAAAGPAAIAIMPVSQTTVEPAGSDLPLFVVALDHIPLA